MFSVHVRLDLRLALASLTGGCRTSAASSARAPGPTRHRVAGPIHDDSGANSVDDAHRTSLAPIAFASPSRGASEDAADTVMARHAIDRHFLEVGEQQCTQLAARDDLQRALAYG